VAAALIVAPGLMALNRSEPPLDRPSAVTQSSPVARAQGGSLWRTPEELSALPIGGRAWAGLTSVAAEGPGDPVDLSNQDSEHGIRTMATALVAARRDDATLRAEVREAIDGIIATEAGRSGGHGKRNRILGVGRNLASYVIAADLIGLRTFAPELDQAFRSWLRSLLSRAPTPTFPELNLSTLDETDPGNWGAYAGASRAAAALYLGDRAEVHRSAEALRHYLEDGAGFVWRDDRDLSWASNPAAPRPINPTGASREGHEIDGIIVADMRRGGGYRWPPKFTQYPREALVGRSIQAELLARAGYPSFEWGDRGLLRAAKRLLALDGLDDRWYEPSVNAYRLIGSRVGGLPVAERAIGRTVAGVDWTHQ
jgi:hypothetical protein